MKNLNQKVLFIVVLIFMVSLSNPGHTQSKPSNWELARDKNGIKVYTRSIEGKTVKEFKAVCRMKTSVNSLVALYNDVPNKTEWVFACNSSKVLKEISPTEKYIYIESKAPWPVSYRDVIIHSVLTQNPETNEVLITEKGIQDYIPANSDIVRIPEYEGFYSFKPIKNGVIEVTFQCFSNPGGKLPAFLKDVSTIDSPFKTLTKMAELVQNEKYQ
jgi:START domain-containing protein